MSPAHHTGATIVEYWRHRLPLLVAILILLFPARSSTTAIVPGDVAPRGNPDGIVNAADILILQQIILGQISPTNEELLTADVAPLGNPDGALNVGDLVVLERAVLGAISLPPVRDDVAPSEADASLITTDSSVPGEIEVSGAAGSVENSSTVTLINFETGATSSIVAGADGSFTVTLAGNTGHVFSVVVHDVAGNSSPAVSVGAGELLNLSVTSPIDGITINEDTILVTGTYSGPPGTAVIVNGRTACTDSTNFYANNIPLVPGSNTLYISASIRDGLRVDLTQTITSTGATPVTVQTDAPCGYAPHAVEFGLTNNMGNAIVQIQADFDGDGTIDLSTSDPSVALSHTYAPPGVYQALFTIDEQSGAQYTARQTIVVSDLTNIDAQLRLVYNTMLDRLRVGAIDGALNQLTLQMQDNFKPVFQALGANLTAAVDQLGRISSGRISENLALYTVLRDENGTKMAYPVYMLRGNDGVWLIGQM